MLSPIKMDPGDISRGKERVPIALENPDDTSEVTDFVYVMCTIPGPSTCRKAFREQIKGCDCFSVKNCGRNCDCLARFGICYSADGRLQLMDGQTNCHHPVYECNSDCSCGQECNNRVVQFGIQCRLMVFRTSNRGFGLRSIDAISKDKFVCEYAGEVLDKETAVQRTKTLSSVPNSNYYILAVKEHLDKGETLTTYIDPMYVGNVGRFINHSCEPNLYMVPVRINNSVPRIALFASRDIEAEEELTFSYRGYVEDPDIEEISLEDEKEVKRTPCHCGSSRCCRYLPLDESLMT